MRIHSFFFLGLFVLFILPATLSQLTIVSLLDASISEEAVGWLKEELAILEKSTNQILRGDIIRPTSQDDEEIQNKFCTVLEGGISLVLDFTPRGFLFGHKNALNLGIPYLRVQNFNYQWFDAVEDLLLGRNASDAALFFASKEEMDRTLNHLIEGSRIEVIIFQGIGSAVTKKLKQMPQTPSHYVAIGNADEILDLFQKAVECKLIGQDYRWIFVSTSTNPHLYNKLSSEFSKIAVDDKKKTDIQVMVPDSDVACFTRLDKGISCDFPAAKLINSSVMKVAKALKLSSVEDIKARCGDNSSLPSSTKAFENFIQAEVDSLPNIEWDSERKQLAPQMKFTIAAINSSGAREIARWTTASNLVLNSGHDNPPIRRYFKIGAIEQPPWLEKNKTGGYLKELADKLAERMDFEYDFKPPDDNMYGARLKNGTWNGLVGELERGIIDMILAPLTVTFERERVIDFVSPSFENSGISIVIRKKQKEQHLFRFITVFEDEVWYYILLIIFVAGVLLWFIDGFGPYAAQNNPEAHSPNSRIFSFIESFWFVLTSFTPQGGGEVPKAISGRLLVAFYGLFVLLVIAAFEANLAAFLTVERMETTVGSLRELADQNKFAFTIMNSSSVQQYLENMAAAEEQLYRVWEELALESSNSDSKFHVWNYPIEETYTHILNAIDKTGTVADAAEGYRKVIESTNGSFAFITERRGIRYQMLTQCHLQEVGEPFALRPYKVAVQQGSHLQSEISKALLQLQKERVFEHLSAKYWDLSKRPVCTGDIDTEGITIDSLAGVFITTVIGVGIAFCFLVWEKITAGRRNCLTDINQNLTECYARIGTTLSRWLTSMGTTLSTWFINMGKTISTWCTSMGNTFSNWYTSIRNTHFA